MWGEFILEDLRLEDWVSCEWQSQAPCQQALWSWDTFTSTVLEMQNIGPILATALKSLNF